MKSPTATFFAVREKGKNSPIEHGSLWSIFWDVTEQTVVELGPDKYEAVRITVEPLDEDAKRTTVTAERDYWRRATAYLASCHAATAYDLLDKNSTPKGAKKRHLSIMEVCISLLKGIWPNFKLQSSDISCEIRRCQECYDHYKDKV